MSLLGDYWRHPHLLCSLGLQIETENGNKTVANLERILEDYKAIRQENSALAAKVRDG